MLARRGPARLPHALHQTGEGRTRLLTQVSKGAAYASVGLVSLMAGGIWAALKPPDDRLLSLVQHIAAGTVFAGLVVGVFSQLLSAAPNPLWLVLGLLVGLAVMSCIRIAGERTGGKALGFTILADVFTDGLLMGLTGTVGDPRSLLLVAGFVPEMILLGVTVAAEFSGGEGRLRKVAIPGLVGCSVVAGGALGGWGASGPRAITTTVQAFGTIAISYLIVEELLREAHRKGASPFLAVMFFAGFIPLFTAGVLLR